MSAIPKDEWRWFGSAGHLIVGSDCRFHLATLVGDVLVSTVGDYHPPHDHDGKPHTIGLERLYETMVFKAGKPCTEPECLCGMPEIAGCEMDFAGYNTRGHAQRGHLDMCEKWAKKVGRRFARRKP